MTDRRTKPMPEAVNRFLSRSRVATVCFIDHDKPHAINCFFAHDAGLNRLVMKSSEGSGHDRLTCNGGSVAGTILPDMISVSGLRGLQFRGTTLLRELIDEKEAARLYTDKFQFARFLPGYFWLVQLQFVKFTDNRIRFGHKLVWNTPAK